MIPLRDSIVPQIKTDLCDYYFKRCQVYFKKCFNLMSMKCKISDKCGFEWNIEYSIYEWFGFGHFKMNY